MAEKILEVGDILYFSKHGSYSNRIVIERVTATQAIAGSIRLRRNSSGIYPKIGGGISTAWYVLETPAIKEKVRRNELKWAISSAKFDSMSTEKLEAIYDIINTI
jgi:hypothetical protein